MKTLFWLFGAFFISTLWAQNTNLIIQQVGIDKISPDNLSPMGFFLQQSIIGKSDRRILRLTSASQQDIALLQIERLSAVVTLSIHESNNLVAVDLIFTDPQTTNTLPAFVSLPTFNWIQKTEEASQKIHNEILRRYPPKPMAEIRTIDVVPASSVYDVKNREISLGVSVGYSGRRISTHYSYLLGGNVRQAEQSVASAGMAFDLSVLWRQQMWYLEGVVHGVFPGETSLFTTLKVGYGVFGGVLTPLLGAALAYDEHFTLLTNAIGDRQEVAFTTLSWFPIIGLRVAFQPAFWFTATGGGLPDFLPSTLWADKKPESFRFNRSSVRLQAHLRHEKHWLFFASWQTVNATLNWLGTTVSYPVSHTYSISWQNNSVGSFTIGAAYVF